MIEHKTRTPTRLHSLRGSQYSTLSNDSHGFKRLLSFESQRKTQRTKKRWKANFDSRLVDLFLGQEEDGGRGNGLTELGADSLVQAGNAFTSENFANTVQRRGI